MAPIEMEITFDKEMRVAIDQIIQNVKMFPLTAERTLAYRSLQVAVMWLGMDLKRIGEQNPGFVANPYPDSKDPSNTRIQPTAQDLKL
jgi:hypothetical protein